jgi:hypothetical protein
MNTWRFEFWITLAVWALPIQVCIRPNDVYGFQFLCFNFMLIKDEYETKKANVKKKFVVRVYGPKDPFHKRESYIERRKHSGEIFAHFALGNWAIMFGFFESFDGLDRFLIVNSEVV